MLNGVANFKCAMRRTARSVSYECSDCGPDCCYVKTKDAINSGLKNIDKAYVDDEGKSIFLAWTDGTTKPADSTNATPPQDL